MQASSDLHVDAVLSEMAVRHPNHQFIADRVFAPMRTKKSTNEFNVFGRDNLRAENDERVHNAESQEAGFTILGQLPLAVKEYALHDHVGDQDRQDADEPIDPEEDTALILKEKVLLGREIRLATKLTATANYETNYSTTLTGTDQWSDYVNSTPISDVKDAKAKVHSGGVAGPYAVLIGQDAFDVVVDHPDILERTKYTSGESITPAMLARIWQVDEVIVGEAVKNTAHEGATDSLSYVWGDNVVLFSKRGVVDPSPKRPSFGYQFYTPLYGGNQLEVRRIPAPLRGRGVVRIEVAIMYDLQFGSVDNLTDKDSIAGYLIKDTVA